MSLVAHLLTVTGRGAPAACPCAPGFTCKAQVCSLAHMCARMSSRVPPWKYKGLSCRESPEWEDAGTMEADCCGDAAAMPQPVGFGLFPRRLHVAAATLLSAALGVAGLFCFVRMFALSSPTEAGIAQEEIVLLAMEASHVRSLLGTGFSNPVSILAASDKLRTASCTLNVLQAAQYLARAGVQIDQATKTCRSPGELGYSSSYKKEACGANAAGVFSSIGWVASYLSLAASQCGRTANVKAVCAGAIEGLVAALGGLAAHANIVAANCVPDAQAETARNTHSDAIWQAARRLEMDMDGKFSPDKDVELATCVLDATEAATALAQMGTGIEAARRGCNLYHATRKTPVVSAATHAICATSVGQVLHGVAQAATFIAAATSHCAQGIDVPALCASGVAGLLSSLAAVVYMGSGINLACVDLPQMGPFKEPFARSMAQGIARRLLHNVSHNGMPSV